MSHDPNLSPRKARVCTYDKPWCGRRSFGDLSWRCPEHPGHTKDQPDNRYFGKVPKLRREP